MVQQNLGKTLEKRNWQIQGDTLEGAKEKFFKFSTKSIGK